MKSRLGLVGMAGAAIALGLLAPSVVNAAPKIEKPSGQALVRIDGGTAYAKKQSKREYRIVAPDGASISWLGEVSGKGTRTGTFNPKVLVAGWTRLGFRDGARAFATLTWAEAGSPRPAVRAATLWSPRVNADGQLTFLAKVTGGPLPKQMVDFSINIARAETRMRTQSRSTWTTVFPVIPIDSSFGLQATVSDNPMTPPTVAWPASSGPANPCRSPISLGTNTDYTVFPGFPCGDGTVKDKDKDGNPNALEYVAPGYGSIYNQLTVYFTFQVTNGSSFTYQTLVAQWDNKGDNKLPAT